MFRLSGGAPQRPMPKLSSATTLAFVLLLGASSAQTPQVMSADLEPETRDAFDRYVQATEARIDKEVTRPGAFFELMNPIL